MGGTEKILEGLKKDVRGISSRLPHFYVYSLKAQVEGQLQVSIELELLRS